MGFPLFHFYPSKAMLLWYDNKAFTPSKAHYSILKVVL